MRKLTEQEKAQLSDEERVALFHKPSFSWARKLVPLRNSYKYFVKNKGWILSLLFVLSIIKSSIWYALFGVNILAYASLQDIFISFAEYFMLVITIGILFIFIYVFYPQNLDNKIEKIAVLTLAIVISLIFLWFMLSLYRMIFSISFLIFMISILIIASSRKISLFIWSLCFLLILTFQPIEQYSSIITNRDARINTLFVDQNAHYDFVSFDYNDTHIDTKKYMYYHIGCNSNYFFILDRKAQETLIIPKNECKNIKSQPFGLSNLRFLRSENKAVINRDNGKE